MRKNDRKALIGGIIILCISIPIIISGIFNNCMMKLDFSGKCFSEQISKGFTEGVNKFAEIRIEKINNKLNHSSTHSGETK